jgi:hypothetical protein
MPNQTTNQHKKRRRSPLGKRQLSSKVTSSNLWIPDRQLFEETARKRHMTDAELMRDIIHKWAVTTRLAPDTEEGAQEIALLNLQKETKKAIEEVGHELSSLLKQLVETVSTHGDLLSLTEAQLNHVTSVAAAHYNVSAQSFAALWSLVEMFQRFYVERTLPPAPDQHQAAVAIRDDIRGEGLRMIETFGSLCESTTPIKMILIYPSAGEPNT